jgi:chromosome segregation ATPase
VGCHFDSLFSDLCCDLQSPDEHSNALQEAGLEASRSSLSMALGTPLAHETDAGASRRYTRAAFVREMQSGLPEESKAEHEPSHPAGRSMSASRLGWTPTSLEVPRRSRGHIVVSTSPSKGSLVSSQWGATIVSDRLDGGSSRLDGTSSRLASSRSTGPDLANRLSFEASRQSVHEVQHSERYPRMLSLSRMHSSQPLVAGGVTPGGGNWAAQDSLSRARRIADDDARRGASTNAAMPQATPPSSVRGQPKPERPGRRSSLPNVSEEMSSRARAVDHAISTSPAWSETSGTVSTRHAKRVRDTETPQDAPPSQEDLTSSSIIARALKSLGKPSAAPRKEGASSSTPAVTPAPMADSSEELNRQISALRDALKTSQSAMLHELERWKEERQGLVRRAEHWEEQAREAASRSTAKEYIQTLEQERVELSSELEQLQLRVKALEGEDMDLAQEKLPAHAPPPQAAAVEGSPTRGAMLRRRLREAEGELASLRSQLDSAQASIRELQVAPPVVDSSEYVSRAEYEAVQHELASLQSRVDDATQRMEEAEAASGRLRRETQQAQRKIEQCEADVAEANAQYHKARVALLDEQSRSEKLDQSVADLEAQLKQFVSGSSTAQSELSSQQETIEWLEKALGEADQTISGLRVALDEAQAEAVSHSRRMTEAVEEAESARRDMLQALETGRAAALRKNEVEVLNTELRAEAEKARARLRNCEGELAAERAAGQALSQSHEGLSQERQRLLEEVERLSEMVDSASIARVDAAATARAEAEEANARARIADERTMRLEHEVDMLRAENSRLGEEIGSLRGRHSAPPPPPPMRAVRDNATPRGKLVLGNTYEEGSDSTDEDEVASTRATSGRVTVESAARAAERETSARLRAEAAAASLARSQAEVHALQMRLSAAQAEITELQGRVVAERSRSDSSVAEARSASLSSALEASRQRQEELEEELREARTAFKEELSKRMELESSLWSASSALEGVTMILRRTASELGIAPTSVQSSRAGKTVRLFSGAPPGTPVGEDGAWNLPGGWEERRDEASGAFFFLHSLTGEVRWASRPKRLHPGWVLVPISKSKPVGTETGPSFYYVFDAERVASMDLSKLDKSVPIGPGGASHGETSYFWPDNASEEISRTRYDLPEEEERSKSWSTLELVVQSQAMARRLHERVQEVLDELNTTIDRLQEANNESADASLRAESLEAGRKELERRLESAERTAREAGAALQRLEAEHSHCLDAESSQQVRDDAVSAVRDAQGEVAALSEELQRSREALEDAHQQVLTVQRERDEAVSRVNHMSAASAHRNERSTGERASVSSVGGSARRIPRTSAPSSLMVGPDADRQSPVGVALLDSPSPAHSHSSSRMMSSSRRSHSSFHLEPDSLVSPSEDALSDGTPSQSRIPLAGFDDMSPSPSHREDQDDRNVVDVTDTRDTPVTDKPAPSPPQLRGDTDATSTPVSDKPAAATIDDSSPPEIASPLPPPPGAEQNLPPPPPVIASPTDDIAALASLGAGHSADDDQDDEDDLSVPSMDDLEESPKPGGQTIPRKATAQSRAIDAHDMPDRTIDFAPPSSIDPSNLLRRPNPQPVQAMPSLGDLVMRSVPPPSRAQSQSRITPRDSPASAQSLSPRRSTSSSLAERHARREQWNQQRSEALGRQQGGRVSDAVRQHHPAFADQS